jgi:hypothetical protein
MRIERRLAAALGAGLVAIASTCSEPTNAVAGPDFRERRTANFVFHYTPADSAGLPALIALMDAELARNMALLGVDSMPVVTVLLYPDLASFRGNNNYESWVTGFVRGSTRIEMLSPNAPNQVFALWPDTRAAHMVSHVVSLEANDDIANNPRWIWEAFALYQSNQRTDPRGVDFFAPDGDPKLSDLDGGIETPLFKVGYLLGEFIVETWGAPMLATLIRQHGNLATTVGLSEEAFIAEFVAFVRARYGLPA